jgi:FHA domain
MARPGKTRNLRQFLCEDVLWSTFQRMAEEQESAIDDLVNDALLAYAQLAGYQTGVTEEDTPPPTPQSTRPTATGRPSASMSATSSLGGRGIPAPGPGLGASALHAPSPPPPPRSALSEGSSGGSTAPLYLVFDNQKYRIDKDQFIIGRGSKSSDLPINDGNISRKHAAVIRRNGTYFIKDLGSTNGIDFKGMRIDNKRIDEGDVFYLCDYELRFTYKR